MSTLNLLPWREEQREKRNRLFFHLLFFFILFTLTLVAIFYFFILQQQTYQGQRNQYLSSEVIKTNQNIAKLILKDKERQQFIQKINTIKTLQKVRSKPLHIVNEIIIGLPKNLYLTQFKQIDNKIYLEGKAESEQQISTYIENLNASIWFSSAKLKFLLKNQSDNYKIFHVDIET